jgi:Lar family restriction alleviation protein
MSKQEKDLKSCPYCGSDEFGDEGVRLRLTSTSNGYCAVICFCGAAGPIRDSAEKAIEAWNTRDHSNGHSAQHSLSVLPASESVSLMGNFKSFEFPMVLQFMVSTNRTGVLHLRQGQEVRALYFRDGKIIAASGNEGLRLGQIGCAKGLISQIQLQEALVKVKKTGRRMGEVLLDLDYINEDELKELIRHQIQETVIELSLWGEGDFEFRDRLIEFDERGIEDINTMRMILEAAVRKDEQVAA